MFSSFFGGSQKQIDTEDDAQTTKVVPKIKKRPERGQMFDAEMKSPYYATSLLTSKIVRRFLYSDPLFRDTLPKSLCQKLDAYEKQFTIGPNNTPGPSCLFELLGYSPPEEQISWKEWKILGNMTKKGAATRFLQSLSNIYPDLLDRDIDVGQSLTIRVAVQHLAAVIIQRNLRSYKARKYIRVLKKLLMASMTLQKVFRVILSRKHTCDFRLNASASRTNMIAKLLTGGLTVAELNPQGKGRMKNLFLFNAGSSQKDYALSRLYTTPIDQKEPDANLARKGILLSDLAEVRAGCKSFRFLNTTDSLRDDTLCFSIIASAGTLDFQIIPTDNRLAGKSRDWVVSSLTLLGEASLTSAVASSRGKYRGGKFLRSTSDFIRPSLREDAERLSALLIKGFWVNECQAGTEIPKTIYLSWKKRRIYLGKKPILDVETDGNKGFQVDDIAEVRRGCISPEVDPIFNFQRPGQVMTIVSSEATVSLAFESTAMRNKICRLFQAFAAVYRIPT